MYLLTGCSEALHGGGLSIEGSLSHQGGEATLIEAQRGEGAHLHQCVQRQHEGQIGSLSFHTAVSDIFEIDSICLRNAQQYLACILG